MALCALITYQINQQDTIHVEGSYAINFCILLQRCKSATLHVQTGKFLQGRGRGKANPRVDKFLLIPATIKQLQ